MGENLLNKVKRMEKYKLPFLSTIIMGFLIHGYKISNTLFNHDMVYNYYSDQNVLGSGRWFLSMACGISSYFDLPWINGILSILYITVTTVIIISIFNVENRFVIVLISALMASFPSVTETFFFGFTADGYMLAMLMAALSVRLSLIDEKRVVSKIVASILICLCCAIYQAYVSFAMVLALIYFMYELLERRYTVSDYFCWIRMQLFIYLAGLISYYGLWKLIMFAQNVQANNYQGISEVGNISLGLIISGFVNTIKSLLLFVLEWNVLEHGFTLYGILNLIFIVAFIIILFISMKKSELYKQKVSLVLFGLCLIALPIAACIWHFTSSSVIYRPMMLYSLCLVFIFAVILCDKYVKNNWADRFAFLIIGIVFNFTLQANISYFYMNQCYEKSHAVGAEMMARIHMIDDGEANRIAVIGNLASKVALGQSEQEHKIHMLSQLLEKHVLYNQEHVVLFLKNSYDLELEPVSSSVLEKLEVSQEISNMDCWPAKDSVCLIEDMIVIKLDDIPENGF